MSESVAVITDIHANLPALQAALGRIEELRIETVYCGGDLVGYGPHPNEACALLARRRIPTIYGNYDYAIARDLDDCGCFYPTPRDREIGEQSIACTLAHRRAIEGLHARTSLRSPLRARRQACAARTWLPAQGERVPPRRALADHVRAHRRPRRLQPAPLRTHAQAMGTRIRRRPCS
jgi:hypothetical protein